MVCGPAVWEIPMISDIPLVLDSSRYSWVSQKKYALMFTITVLDVVQEA